MDGNFALEVGLKPYFCPIELVWKQQQLVYTNDF